MFLLVALLLSFHTSPVHSASPRENANDESLRLKMDEVSRDWQDRLEKVPKMASGKLRNEAQSNESDRFFTEIIGDDESARDEFISWLAIAPDTGFRNFGAGWLLHSLAKENDRARLVLLLSHYCPDRLGLHNLIEAHLIVVLRDELKDGTLVLCDAYDASKNAENRRRIAGALRRGFRSVGITSDDDDKLVAGCRKWYGKHKDEFVPNEDYSIYMGDRDAMGVFKPNRPKAKNRRADASQKGS